MRVLTQVKTFITLLCQISDDKVVRGKYYFDLLQNMVIK